MRDDHTFSRRAVMAGFAAIPTLSATTAAANAHMSLFALGQKLNAVSQATGQEPPTVDSSPAWPDAATTGVPKDTTLTNIGNITTSAHGQVISELNVNGTITINNAGVKVRNCRADNIFIKAPNVTLENCNVVGGSWNSGINVLANSATILRCDISGMENGIWLEAIGCLIAENYLHDLAGTPDAHIDGLQIPENPKTSNIIIRHNNFDLNITNTSSCITMTDATNIQIDNNRLNGGAYSIYFEGSTSGCTVTNNLFLEHAFGYLAGNAARAQTYKDNTFTGRGSRRKTA